MGAWAARYVSRWARVFGLDGSLSISLLMRLMGVLGEPRVSASVWLSSHDVMELVFALIISCKTAFWDVKLVIILVCALRAS